MEDFNSKYTGQQVEDLLDQVASVITVETDPVFSASPAATITKEKITVWDDAADLVGPLDQDIAQLYNDLANKQDAISDLQAIREGAAKGATSAQSSDIEDVARKDSGYVVANGILDENDDYWHLPKNSLNDKEHTLASKSDIEEKILVIGDSSDEAKANFIAVANGEKTADTYVGSVDTQGYIVEGCVKLARSGSSSNLMHSFTIIGSPTVGQYVNKLIKVICRLVNGEISSEVNVIGTYSKPSTGIPKTDLASDVQNALEKAENAASKDKVGDMDVLPTQGFFGQSNGAVYALPNESTGDEDDILLSRDTVKTINGESIFGSGSITIAGGSGEKGDKGDKGDTGATGVGVQSVKQTTISNTDGGSNVVTVTLTNGTTSTFTVKNGSKGSSGSNGTNGKDGADGATFTPSVDSAGNLSWSNDKGLANPPTVNIKGPKGDKGDAGEGGGGSAGKEVVKVGSGVIELLEPNKLYILSSPNYYYEISGLPYEGGDYAEYHVIINAINEFAGEHEDSPITLVLPDGVSWANGAIPDISKQGQYELSIVYFASVNWSDYLAVLTPFKPI